MGLEAFAARALGIRAPVSALDWDPAGFEVFAARAGDLLVIPLPKGRGAFRAGGVIMLRSFGSVSDSDVLSEVRVLSESGGSSEDLAVEDDALMTRF